MISLPESVRALAAALNRLPGIGPRSAERLALHLVQAPPDEAATLAQTLIAARERTHTCPTCGALADSPACAVCTDSRRDPSLLCVVERPTEILRIEGAANFRGRYHVLGGRLSPVDGVGPEDLRIAELEARLDREPVREVILALAMDVEGDATSHYLGKRLAPRGLRLTRLAHGLPAGTGLEFADDLTLSHALEGRRELL
jgi:recombination protein RecR